MFQTVSLKKIKLLILLSFAALTPRAQSREANIDVEHYTFAIQLNDQNDEIKGEAEISLKIFETGKIVELNLVNRNATGKGMTIATITENGKALKFEQDSSAVKIYTAGAAQSRHNYHIKYSGVPADGLIISKNKYGHRTFFGDTGPTVRITGCPA